MIRLLLAGTVALLAYRLARRMIDEVPDNFDPLPAPGSDREALRRQSAAMGVDPRR